MFYEPLPPVDTSGSGSGPEGPSALSSVFSGRGRMAHMIREFMRLESAGGFMLVAAAILAMIVANSPLMPFYEYVLNDVHLTVGFTAQGSAFSSWTLDQSILHWVNDGLMVIFFFLVGLEIKREFKEGHLSSRDRAVLPLIAALGGMAVPAAIFYAMTHYDPALVRGWAIPSATDIAFTLGVLAVLGSRVPMSLKILVTAIAVIDDLGAIIIIALFYGSDMNIGALAAAAGFATALIVMNLSGVGRPAIFILVGFLLWVAILESGVHATIAGVITAFCIPIVHPRRPHERPCEALEHKLHPWVAFFILPLFAFVNAGVPLGGVTAHSFIDPVTLGITLGLFLGKQIGIFTAIWTTIRLGVSPKPEGARWSQVYGVAILCGIGFTMSLFIGGLSYTSTDLEVEVRLGVMCGSILSAVVGYVLLARLGAKHA